MTLEGLNKRLAALEQATKITRVCLAFPRDEGAEFLGYAVAPLFRQRWHDSSEDFEVFGDDPKECASRAHDMALVRWQRDLLLFVSLDPLTNPPTPR